MTLALPCPTPSAPDPTPSAVPGALSVGPLRSCRRPADAPLARLLLEAQCGREDPFAELYRLTRGRVYAAVLRVVRCPELAGEVTQEAYLQIWQQCGRYQPDKGSVLGWMTMIARRRAVDRVRSVTRSVDLEHRWYNEVEASLSVDDWDEVTARLDAHEIRQTLTALSAVQREVLALLYLEQRTMVEAARILGVPLATVKSRSRDGLARLRALLTDPASTVTPRR